MNKTASRRNILSVMSSVFDPLGLAAPYVLKAKIILQELCKEKVDWDEPISPKHRRSWERWLKELEALNDVNPN